ncbi:preprotein translocase subunit SecG [Rhodomicrobium lacus]|uniref:preprotein translocase subunit SecG n=1 Tax=Rhodomicrobium lacus TaxID=2498452 RepID=UPI000F8CCCF6|nr:preprotein translocase subunit SecG [Rhodomicrobium lacus]
MANVLLVLHIVVAVTMIVIILLQRSEGGALGMGGGGGGFVSGRGAANVMTRTTAILAAIFFLTSITLGIIGQRKTPTSAITPTNTTAPATAPSQAPAESAPALPKLSIPKPAAPAQ